MFTIRLICCSAYVAIFLLFLLCNTSYATETSSDDVANAKREINKKLSSVQCQQRSELVCQFTKGVPYPFVEANRLLNELSVHVAKGTAAEREVLRLKLKVLEACYTARKGYDLENPPPIKMNVSPGLGPGLMPGMPPEAIQDPVIRDEYRKKIAENQYRAAEFSKQNNLQRIVEERIFDLGVHLRLSKQSGRLNQDLDFIRQTVTDEGLKKKLEKEVMAKVCGKEGK